MAFIFIATIAITLSSSFFTLTHAQKFRGALIVPVGWGFNDFQDVPDARITKILLREFDDFTVAAADTTRSYLGFLTGMLQTDISIDSDPSPELPPNNIHSLFNQNNITTYHAGKWPFKQAPNTSSSFISDDPVDTLNKALDFATKYERDSYFMTIFLPLVDASFIPNQQYISKTPGVSVTSEMCPDKERVEGRDPRYQYCLRQIHVASRRYEDVITGKLLQKLKASLTSIIWTPAHGPFNPHTHATSAPKTSLRGEHRSLYDGGIRTRGLYCVNEVYVDGILKNSVKISLKDEIQSNSTTLAPTITTTAAPTNIMSSAPTGPPRKTINPNIFLSKSANAIDILPTFASLANIPVTFDVDGKDLTDFQSKRKVKLKWTTGSLPIEGHCLNSSPAIATLIENGAYKYKMMYDKERLEVYDWDSGYELEQANVKFSPPLPRPSYTVPGCSNIKATTIQRKPDNSKKIKGIINILADDFGFGDLSYTSRIDKLGDKNYPSTPELDKFIKSSLFFNNFYASGSTCSPTRASLMTGRYPFHRDVGVYEAYPGSTYSPDYGLPKTLGIGRGLTYITSFFQDHGWKTGHFGKWHLGFKDGKPLGLYGIDNFRCYLCPGGKDVTYNNQELFFSANSSQYIFADATQWIEYQIKANNKFYVTIALQNAHSPLNIRPDQADQLGFKNSENPYLIQSPVLVKELERSHQIYSALIKEQDNRFGELIKRLESLNAIDDVLIVWSSDNGPESPSIYFGSVGNNGPHRGAKRSVYEGGIHVPFMLKWGDRLTGVTDILAATIDLYPTLVGFAGLNIKEAEDHERLDGMDLSDCILNNNCHSVLNRTMIWEKRGSMEGVDCLGLSPRFAIRRGNFKLLLESDDKKKLPQLKFTRTELYNIAEDPTESTNLASKYPSIVDELTAYLESYPYYDMKYWPPEMILHFQTYKNKNMYVGFSCDPGE